MILRFVSLREGSVDKFVVLYADEVVEADVLPFFVFKGSYLCEDLCLAGIELRV